MKLSNNVSPLVSRQNADGRWGKRTGNRKERQFLLVYNPATWTLLEITYNRMGDCRAASSSKEMFLICAVSMCVCLLACAWVCAFRQKVNWVAAVVPETQTTGFVIAVTFLPAPLAHSRRWCEWADAQGASRGRCCVTTSLYKVSIRSIVQRDTSEALSIIDQLQ